MPFQRNVQIGRVVYVNYGPDAGKTGVIVNVLNENRVQIDGDSIERQVIPVRRLKLTNIVMNNVLVGQRTSVLRTKIAAFKLGEKWAATKIAQRLATQQRRAQLNDFTRFKVMIVKRQVRAEAAKIKVAPAATKAAPKTAPAANKKK